MFYHKSNLGLGFDVGHYLTNWSLPCNLAASPAMDALLSTKAVDELVYIAEGV